MTDVTEALEVLEKLTPQEAAIGLDKLYTTLEQNEELQSKDMFLLRKFVVDLIQKAKQLGPSTSNAWKFRIHGLSMAIDECIKSIRDRWSCNMLTYTSDILETTIKVPDHVDVANLVSQASAGGLSQSDAVKLSQQLIAKLPGFCQRMQCFEQLFRGMKLQNQDKTRAFMTVVHNFKEASKRREGSDDSGDDKTRQNAMDLIPDYIQRVFFPRNGYCALYQPDRKEHLRYVHPNEVAEDKLYTAVGWSPRGSRTAISKVKTPGCKMELRSVLRNNEVEFVIVNKHPLNDSDRILTYTTWNDVSCTLDFITLEKGNDEDNAACRYIFEPHGWYFTIKNAKHGGILTIDPWNIFGSEPAVHVMSCKISPVIMDTSYWQVEQWYI